MCDLAPNELRGLPTLCGSSEIADLLFTSSSHASLHHGVPCTLAAIGDTAECLGLRPVLRSVATSYLKYTHPRGQPGTVRSRDAALADELLP